MRCPHCSHETPDGSAVCVACHAPIAASSVRAQASRRSTFDVAVTGVQTPPQPGSAFGTGFMGGFAPVSMQSGYVFASRYRIEKLLGAGGMGAVYHAFDEELGVPIALKVIRPDVVGTPGMA